MWMLFCCGCRADEVKKERIAKFEGMNLYVKNLADEVEDEVLREHFDGCGTIVSCKVSAFRWLCRFSGYWQCAADWDTMLVGCGTKRAHPSTNPDPRECTGGKENSTDWLRVELLRTQCQGKEVCEGTASMCTSMQIILTSDNSLVMTCSTAPHKQHGVYDALELSDLQSLS